MRADQLLLERQLAGSRSQAQRLIAAGVQWRLPGAAWQPVRKNGEELPVQAELQLQDAAETRYVSRGGLKLEGALQAIGLDVTGLRCLDVGQSTGGFTDCLLQHGAAQVTGLDVGQAVATGAGALPARWVIHTVGPNRHRGETDPALLASCFSESLRTAAALGARSVAFPAVSAGVFGWDVQEVAVIAVSAVRSTDDAGLAAGVDLVRFVPFGTAATLAFEAALAGAG